MSDKGWEAIVYIVSMITTCVVAWVILGRRDD